MSSYFASQLSLFLQAYWNTAIAVIKIDRMAGSASQHAVPKLSLENFDAHTKHTQVLNSPRSLEACKREGILPRELLFVSKDEYSKIFAAEQLDDYNMQIRFDHMEKRRQDKLRIVTELRLKLIEDEKAGIDIYAQHGSYKGTAKGSAAGMLSREANMIEKIKKNQRKEVEQMMQYEIELQAQREKNEEKARIQHEKELKRQREVEAHRKEAALKKEKYEEEKKKKLEEEESKRTQLEQEHYLKEKQKEEDQKRQAQQKKEEQRRKEEEQKKKQIEFKMATEKILDQQRTEMLKKKEEMEYAEVDRKRREEEAKKIRQERAQARKEEMEAKIDELKKKNDIANEKRKQEYEEKERQAEEKKKAYEHAKEVEREKVAEKFKKKEELIEKAKSSNQQILMKKKEDYFSQLAKNEEKKKLLEMEKKRELELQHQRELDKQKKREEKKEANLKIMESKKGTLIKTANDKDMKLRATQDKREKDRMYQNNLEAMRKLDKLDNVKRNERKKEYERQQLWMKILDENQKIDQMKNDQKHLLMEKADVKAKIARDKEELARKFQLVKEGKLNPQALVENLGGGNEATGFSRRGNSQARGRDEASQRSGGSMRNTSMPKGGSYKGSLTKISVEGGGAGAKAPGDLPKPATMDSKRPAPASPSNRVGSPTNRNGSPQNRNRATKGGFELKPGETLEVATARIKDQQGREMLRVLEEECKAENNRDGELAMIMDPVEKKRLEKIHKVQKAKAKERINMLMKKHEDELEDLRGKMAK
jgi:hypothetical protein